MWKILIAHSNRCLKAFAKVHCSHTGLGAFFFWLMSSGCDCICDEWLVHEIGYFSLFVFSCLMHWLQRENHMKIKASLFSCFPSSPPKTQVQEDVPEVRPAAGTSALFPSSFSSNPASSASFSIWLLSVDCPTKCFVIESAIWIKAASIIIICSLLHLHSWRQQVFAESRPTRLLTLTPPPSPVFCLSCWHKCQLITLTKSLGP